MGKPKPPLPSCLRGDGMCSRAPTGTFEIPSRGQGGRAALSQRRYRRYRIAVAQSFCNGTMMRQRCPFRAECLAWALEANELGVYGGIEITTGTLRRKDATLREQEERRAAEETGAPPHRRGQLAEQPRQTG